jgi:hypothetical protein
MGRSRGPVEVEAASHMRALWAETGIDTDTTMEDGLIVERPDYWVLRVTFAGMNESEVDKFRRALRGNTTALDMAEQTNAILDRLRRRLNAKTRGLEFKYVNVAGGRRGGTALQEARRHLERHGLSRFLDEVPGPLFRSSHGKVLTHMPLAIDSSYTHLIGALKKAYQISSRMAEPDPDLDLEGLSEPKFAHHTFRRTSDKVARDSMELTGASKDDIDDQYGWRQAERAKDQQSAYAGPRSRSHRARISMMM